MTRPLDVRLKRILTKVDELIASNAAREVKIAKLKDQRERLREELRTAPRDGWSAQREARVDALLRNERGLFGGGNYEPARCELGGPYDPCYDPKCPQHGTFEPAPPEPEKHHDGCLCPDCHKDGEPLSPKKKDSTGEKASQT